MSTYTYWIERNGEDIPVEVEYHLIPYRPATQYEPAEGGVEIENVRCAVAITADERHQAECAAYDAAMGRDE